MPRENITKTSWPRNKVNKIECRKRDLIIRIANWTRDKEEPAYDVEVYQAGVYDWNLSSTITTKSSHRSKAAAKRMAIEIAQMRIAELLK